MRAYLVAGVIRFAYDSSLRVDQLEGDFVFVFRNDGFELGPTGPVAFVVGAQPLNSSTHFSIHSYRQNTLWRYVLQAKMDAFHVTKSKFLFIANKNSVIAFLASICD